MIHKTLLILNSPIKHIKKTCEQPDLDDCNPESPWIGRFVYVQVLEIKRLNTQAAVIRSELNKLEEQLEDCRKYRAFLDRITPSEHFSAAETAQADKRRLQVEAWQAECDALKQRKRASRGMIALMNVLTQGK